MDFNKSRYNPYGTEQDELPYQSVASSEAPIAALTTQATDPTPLPEERFDTERIQRISSGAQLETQAGLIIQNDNSRLEIAEFNWFGYNSKTLLVGEKSTINFSLGSQGMSEFSFDYFALHNSATVINFYDASGTLIGSEKLFYTGSVTAKQFDIKTLSFTAPAGTLIARAELITGDEPGVGDYGFHIDNVKWTSTGLIPVGFTFDHMNKDSGSSSTDFITKDGTAGRQVEGTLSRALSASETLQFWDGSKWVDASVTGMSWKAQDDTAHSTDWAYKLRVMDSAGNVTPEQSHQVMLDTTPSDVQVSFIRMSKDDDVADDWETTDGSAGRTVQGTLDKALDTGDIIEYSLDGGKTWLALSVDFANNWSFTDNGAHTASWEYQIRITDIAGNVNTPVKQAVTLAEVKPAITEVWDNVGGNDLVPDHGYTDDLTPTLKGTGQPGSTLDIYAFYTGEHASNKIGAVVVKADGTWEWTPSAPMRPGEVTFDVLTKTFLISDPITINLTAGPTIDKAFDDVGQVTDWLANGDATDDSTPRLFGSALPGSLVYLYDDGKLIASVTASASGDWEWEHATGMSVGRHSITVKMEQGAFISDFSTPWVFEYVNMQPVSFTLTSMQKDTGSSQTDFITKDGSANREVTGTLSRTLAASETLQLWDGSKWVNATVSGMSWKAQDGTAHSADWEYKLRVVNSLGDSSPEQNFQVILDTTPSDVRVSFIRMSKDDGVADDWQTTDGSAGRTVQGTLSKALDTGDIIEYSLNGGKTWLALNVDASNNWSFTDGTAHTASWEYQIRITDIAGNVTTPVKQTVTLADIKAAITEVWDNVGGNDRVPANGYSDDLTPTLKGTGQPGATLMLSYTDEFGRAVVGQPVIVKADGTWEWTPGIPLEPGQFTFELLNSAYELQDEITINLVAGPTIDKAFDDAGQISDWLANGDATDDSTPRLYGSALPGSLVYLYDDGKLIASVTASASGEWEWEHATGMSVGRHSITVKMEQGAFISDFSTPWVFEYVNMQPVSFNLTSMQKDTGSSQTDLITKDGSANREVTGTLSRALAASETLQLWDGSKWVNATVSGMSWKAQDGTAHSADWEYKLRVVNSLGDSSPEQNFQVILDTTPSDVQVSFIRMSKDDGVADDWQTTDGSAGRTVQGTLSNALDTGDIIEYSLDGGKTWLALSVDASNHWSFIDNVTHTDDWEYQIRITDIAGNVTTPVKQTVTLADIAPVITEIWDDVGDIRLVPNKGYSDDLTPRLVGTGQPNSQLEVWAKYGSNNIIKVGTVDVQADGSWTWTQPTQITSGSVRYAVISSSGVDSNVYDLTLVKPPTIDKAFDNAGAITEWLANGAKTDDSAPRLYGSALPGSLVYLYDNGKLIASVTANASGAWEWEHASGHAEGKHSITVKMEQGDFKSDFSQPWEFEYVSLQPISFTLTRMEKDTGFSQTDFITNDGTANREVIGAISRALVAGETLQFWNGSAWINATVTGQNWKAQDATAHSNNWVYKLRVVDGNGSVSPEKEFTVVLDNTPSDNTLKFELMEKDDGAHARDWITSDGSKNRLVEGSLARRLETGETIQYSLDKGKTWQTAISVEQSWKFTDNKAHTSDWEYQVRIIDIAGNASPAFKQTVTLVKPFTYEVWDYFGGSDVVPKEGFSDDRQPTLKGTGTPNQQIDLAFVSKNGTKTLASKTVTISSDGTWEWKPDVVLPLGEVNVSIFASTGIYFPITIVAPPTIESAFDDVKNIPLPSGATSADYSPEFAGKAHPKSTVYIYDGAKLIDSVKADASGAWEWEYGGGLSVGLHKINVKMGMEGFLSSSSDNWEFIYADPLVIKFSKMDKDTGVSQTDFITNDGTAGRDVTGTLSKPLEVGEKLSLWNGSNWTDATINGLTWTVRDNSAHSSNWTYKIQVLDSKYKLITELSKNVVLDKVAAAPVIDRVYRDFGIGGGYMLSGGKTKDKTPIFEGKIEKGAVITIEYGLSNGSWLGSATVSNISQDNTWTWQPSTPFYDATWHVHIRYTDKAGNVSAWSPNFVITIDSKSSTFAIENIVAEAEWDGTAISGVTLDEQAPITLATLNVTGSHQSLDLTQLHQGLASINTIDLTGQGDNQLTISAADVLALGQQTLFIDDDKKQIQVKGNAGDSAILARQLENFDADEWVIADGTITSSGIEYHVWQNQHSDVEILIQAGLKTELM
ncbi:Ig-like domain-containing protein [Pantoea sp.]|uniref:Ig-like domain-containing protein n=1 Tax=Pantoea sp. TaxID=69393 RepID=UPI0031D67140